MFSRDLYISIEAFQRGRFFKGEVKRKIYFRGTPKRLSESKKGRVVKSIYVETDKEKGIERLPPQSFLLLILFPNDRPRNKVEEKVRRSGHKKTAAHFLTLSLFSIELTKCMEKVNEWISSESSGSRFIPSLFSTGAFMTKGEVGRKGKCCFLLFMADSIRCFMWERYFYGNLHCEVSLLKDRKKAQLFLPFYSRLFAEYIDISKKKLKYRMQNLILATNFIISDLTNEMQRKNRNFFLFSFCNGTKIKSDSQERKKLLENFQSVKRPFLKRNSNAEKEQKTLEDLIELSKSEERKMPKQKMENFSPSHIFSVSTSAAYQRF